MGSTRNADLRDSNRNFKSHSPNRKKSLRGVVNRPLKSLSPGLNRGDPHQHFQIALSLLSNRGQIATTVLANGCSQ